MQPVRAFQLLLRTRGLTSAVLVVLAALVWIPPALPKPPDPVKPANPVDAPLFNEGSRDAAITAILVPLSGAIPQTGSLTSIAGLHVGEDPAINAWSLKGPMSIRWGRLRIGSTSLFLNGFHPGVAAPTLVSTLPVLATLRAGDVEECWTLFDTDKVRPLPEALLEPIRDGEGILAKTLEAEAYAQIIVMANYTSHKGFLEAARHDLSYGHLFNHPEEYRGQVVFIEGKLRRLLRVSPQFEAASEGVCDLYVGYIFSEEIGAHPYRVIFTEWPRGLPPSALGEKIDPPLPVQFAGYFYKRYRYEAGDNKGTTRRDAPMLIGHSLTYKGAPPPPPPPTDTTAWVHSLIYLFMGITAAAVVLIVVLTLWFRGADSRVRRRIRAAREGELVLPPPDPTPAPPVGSGRASTRSPVRVSFPARNNLPPGFGDRGGEPDTGGSGGKEGGKSGDPDEGAGA